jgi:hypothetical protein
MADCWNATAAHFSSDGFDHHRGSRKVTGARGRCEVCCDALGAPFDAALRARLADALRVRYRADGYLPPSIEALDSSTHVNSVSGDRGVDRPRSARRLRQVVCQSRGGDAARGPSIELARRRRYPRLFCPDPTIQLRST